MKIKSAWIANSALLALAASGVATVVSAQDAAQRTIPPSRQGVVDQSKANSPNGGRPEINGAEEMAQKAPYTASGAAAYARLAAVGSEGEWPVTLYYRCKYPRGGTSISAAVPKPMRVFDDVYSIGDDANNIWAIDTSDGIILIDTLSSERDAKEVIVPHMRQVGLDPSKIRMIIVTHEHGDHYGGAAYLKSISGAKIAAVAQAWDAKIPAGRQGMPVRAADDIVLTDGQTLSLGGRDLLIVHTPGHTDGTISLIFPVTEGSNRHVAALFGGQGKPGRLDALMEFRTSLGKFADATDRMQADVILSNHTVGDDGLTKIAQLAARKPGEPNPYVVGRASVIRYDALFRACLSADIDQIIRDAAQKD